jgi:hypothetical protein
MNTPTYVASMNFTSNVEWLETGSQVELMNASLNGDNAEPARATCAVVGVVSSLRLLLEPHGNYNPNYEKAVLETSKLQFQITCPTSHPEFATDFDVALQHIDHVQKKAITEGPKAENFIVADSVKKALKFSWPLFEKRVCTVIVRIPYDD